VAWPLPNVWIGVSVENQHFAHERLPFLVETPAAKRFISYEPALEAVDFGSYLRDIDWLIVGGESGRKARPFDLAWARWAVRQCDVAGCHCFVKQLGANPYEITGGPDSDFLDLRSPSGGDMDEWPEDLRVREFPA
jgi:protein gp37